MNVYIVKWNKEDAPWQRILADILKKDYKIEQCPEILKDEMGKPYLEGNPLYFNVNPALSNPILSTNPEQITFSCGISNN